MWILRRFFVYVLALIFITFIVYYLILSTSGFQNDKYWQIFERNENKSNTKTTIDVNNLNNKFGVFHLWCIFTKVTENSAFQYKFQNLVKSIFRYTYNPIHLHIISDIVSENIASKILEGISNKSYVDMKYTFYNITSCAQNISDIVDTMTPYFSSQPGTYYSDALFYLSLGLHRIAPKSQDLAVMVDCDVEFRNDITLLYNEFNRFKPSNLFGMTYELTPVYLHALYRFRHYNKNKTTFGDYIHDEPISSSGNHRYGFPGYNSGVVLFNLSAIRESVKYKYIISKNNVKRLIEKYMFKGHLGDQDLYTLLGHEYPELFRTIPCKFNRQLCKWWRDHGYKRVFGNYSKCHEDIVIYHGNCNSPIPE